MNFKHVFKQVVFSVLLLGMIAAGVMLGQWQLQRHAWKTKLLANLDAAWATPLDHEIVRTDLFISAPDDTYFKRGMITGLLIPSFSVLSGPHSHNGQSGFYWLTPMQGLGGVIVWVNRGFVPKDFTIPSESAMTISVSGLLYDPAPIGLVTRGPNMPFDKFTRVSEKLSGKKNTRVSPLLFRALVPVTDTAGVVVLDAKPEFRNSHMAYAIFWFAMSGVAALYGIFRVLRGLRSAHQKVA